jgi:hypothetical protein
MRSTIRLGRIRGIEVGVNWSLLVVAVLIVASLSGSLLPSVAPDAHGSYLAAGILGAALFFASILAHELSHALVAQRNGQEVDGITLWLLGGVARLKNEAPSAKAELKVAAVGPATSLALGAAFLALAHGLDAIQLVVNGRQRDHRGPQRAAQRICHWSRGFWKRRILRSAKRSHCSRASAAALSRRRSIRSRSASCRSLRWRMPAATPSTRSSRRRNSG